MNNECLNDKEFLEFARIYESSICCGVTEQEGQTNARLIFADLMAILIKIKTNFECCKNKECPANPIRQLRLLLNNSGDVLYKHLYPKNIEILQTLIDKNK